MFSFWVFYFFRNPFLSLSSLSPTPREPQLLSRPDPDPVDPTRIFRPSPADPGDGTGRNRSSLAAQSSLCWWMRMTRAERCKPSATVRADDPVCNPIGFLPPAAATQLGNGRDMKCWTSSFDPWWCGSSTHGGEWRWWIPSFPASFRLVSGRLG